MGWLQGNSYLIFRGRKKNASSPDEERKYAAFGGISFGGLYLTLIWLILFHFLAVSVYDEGWCET